MNMLLNFTRVSPLIASALVWVGATAEMRAGAVIVNPAGKVALGVNDEGHLNLAGSGLPTRDANGVVGLSFIDGGVYVDATAPKVMAEGWGVSGVGTDGVGVSGFANIGTNPDGAADTLDVLAFQATATSAVSTVRLKLLPALSVTQAYFPASEPGAADVLFQSRVTITNHGPTTITDLRYVRVVDWDIPPTEFSEYVSIIGTASTQALLRSHDNGFASADPLETSLPLNASTLNQDFSDIGPGNFALGDAGQVDHGAYFQFGFGNLAAGESKVFSLYYGAARSEREVLGAFDAVGVNLYSLGQSSLSAESASAGTPYTFALGFAGLDSAPVTAPPLGAVPEPSTYGLLAASMLSAALWLRRIKPTRSP